MNLKELSEKYYLSSDFNSLADKTKVDYQYCCSRLLDTEVDGNFMAEMCLTKLNGAMARRGYEVWLSRGTFSANAICSVSRKIYSFAMEMGYVETNPFSTFKRKATQVRKVVWTKEQVKQFLDTAYSKFRWRNMGLIVQMSYEWCQRVGDMRMLEFENIDFDKQILNLEQSKRRALVHLPISDELTEILQQQHQEFGFQKYVAPYPYPFKGLYKTYSLTRLSKVARDVMNASELPKELRIADLRRTGTTEMVEAGVPMGQIMSVTGHANPSSVKPYMKNTLASAENALTKRNLYGKSI